MDDSKNLAGYNHQHTQHIKNYNKSFVWVLIGTLFFALLSVLSYVFWRYLGVKSQMRMPDPLPSYIQSFSDDYNDYGQRLHVFDLLQYVGLQLKDNGTGKVQRLLADSSLNYVQKRDLLQQAVTTLGVQILDLKEQSKQLTQQLNQDGFFPQELVSIIKQENAVGSIQRSLLSLEIVKFSSAMKVFSLMDVFLTSLSDNLSYNKAEIKAKLEALFARGENDVKNYLNYCYNNPYEPAKCNTIKDFDRYYATSNYDQDFDTHFFKRLMELIDTKLEYSNMPSFSITFNRFDGKSNSIAFTIEVNTLKEDEYALIKQGIKSPHIFIVSELIKLLKQSTFIVGKSIDAKDVKVNAKQISIGGAKYTVNNSVKTFTLPIQKGTEREIFDYVDTYQLRLEEQQDEEQTTQSITESIQEMFRFGEQSNFLLNLAQEALPQELEAGFVLEEEPAEGEDS
ncbi:MAG: hypothetical protein Q4B28_07945 [bacterium]|nr:hypothetical protein [bacterium]